MQVTHIQHFETKLGANNNHKQTTLGCIHSNEALRRDVSSTISALVASTSTQSTSTSTTSLAICAALTNTATLSDQIFITVFSPQISPNENNVTWFIIALSAASAALAEWTPIKRLHEATDTCNTSPTQYTLRPLPLPLPASPLYYH